MLGVPRNLPQLQVEDIRGDDLLVSSFPILLSNKITEFVVYSSTMRQPKTAARRQRMEEEQLLLRWNPIVTEATRNIITALLPAWYREGGGLFALLFLENPSIVSFEIFLGMQFHRRVVADHL